MDVRWTRSSLSLTSTTSSTHSGGSSQTTIGLGRTSGRAILTLGELAIRGIEHLSFLLPEEQRVRLTSQSEISILSTSIPSSYCTDYTSSTVPGPGELSGKAIKALGTVALELVDEVWLRRQLAGIKVFFPHGRYFQISEDDGKIMYENLVELSRPGVYSTSVEHLALELIFGQIRHGEISQLMRCMKNWDVSEMEAFLFHVMKRAFLSKTMGVLDSFATFLFQVSLVSQWTCQASRTVARVMVGRLMVRHNPRLSQYLNVLLLSNQDTTPNDIPLLQFKPSERKEIWRQVSFFPEPMAVRNEWIQLRRRQIDKRLELPSIAAYERSSICSDLIEFCRPAFDDVESGINSWAFAWLLTYIARGLDFQLSLIQALMLGDDEDRKSFMRRALYHIPPKRPQKDVSSPFLEGFVHACERYAPLRGTPMAVFLDFILRAVGREAGLRVLHPSLFQDIIDDYAPSTAPLKLSTWEKRNSPRVSGTPNSNSAQATPSLEVSLCWRIYGILDAHASASSAKPHRGAIPRSP